MAAAGSSDGLVVPAAFPPPVNPVQEFVGPPTDPEEERIEVGVVIVGGGPAGLACANRLLQLLAEDEALATGLGEVPVAVVEKGKVCGAHNLSGAIMRPSAMITIGSPSSTGRRRLTRKLSQAVATVSSPSVTITIVAPVSE